MPSKAAIAPRLTIRRGLSEPEAALYIGLSASKFRSLVKDGRLPKPRVIDTRRIWDVDDLDAAFKAFPLEGGEETDSWHDFQ
jgi:predicted DNA-binding transcriptional regulator AlpA